MNAVWLINLFIIKKEIPAARLVCACRRLVDKMFHGTAPL